MEKGQIPAMKTLLVDLRLDRVDLVHTGSNTRADILLKKGKEQDNMPNDFETLLASLKPEQAGVIKSYIATVEKSKDDTHATVLSELNDKIETLEKAATPPIVEEVSEDIYKNASPELKSYVEKMRSQLDVVLADQAESLAKARYEAVKAIPCDEAELNDVLKSISPAAFTVLQKAAKAIEEGLLTAKGKDAPGEFIDNDNAYVALEKAAKEIMTKEADVTFEQAFSKACEVNADVYAKYVKGAK